MPTAIGVLAVSALAASKQVDTVASAMVEFTLAASIMVDIAAVDIAVAAAIMGVE